MKKEKEGGKKLILNRCKNCGSSQIYIRRIRNERVCNHCGFIEDIFQEKKIEGKNEK